MIPKSLIFATVVSLLTTSHLVLSESPDDLVIFESHVTNESISLKCSLSEFNFTHYNVSAYVVSYLWNDLSLGGYSVRVGSGDGEPVWGNVKCPDVFSFRMSPEEHHYPNFTAIIEPTSNSTDSITGAFKCLLAFNDLQKDGEKEIKTFLSPAWNTPNAGLSLGVSINVLFASIAWTVLLQIFR